MVCRPTLTTACSHESKQHGWGLSTLEDPHAVPTWVLVKLGMEVSITVESRIHLGGWISGPSNKTTHQHCSMLNVIGRFDFCLLEESQSCSVLFAKSRKSIWWDGKSLLVQMQRRMSNLVSLHEINVVRRLQLTTLVCCHPPYWNSAVMCMFHTMLFFLHRALPYGVEVRN